MGDKTINIEYEIISIKYTHILILIQNILREGFKKKNKHFGRKSPPQVETPFGGICFFYIKHKT